MSDFDREAERERLREKYERDKKEREAAEQMSELLLQGATMTNAHCSACGTPIFRYDGQEFCPTCQRPVDRENGADDGDGEADAGDGDDGKADVEVTAPSDDTRVVFGGEDDDRSAESGTQPRPQETSDARDRGEPAERPDGSPGGQRVDTSGADLETARASLVRTLVAFSQRAEATDDPRQAREHLQAAREAAETLAALR